MRSESGSSMIPWGRLHQRALGVGAVWFCIVWWGAAAPGQGPGGQHEAYFPPPKTSMASDEQRRQFVNVLRELRKGSGPDRVEARHKLMSDYERHLGSMLDVLRAGKANHFEQRQVCLVLMQVGDGRVVPVLKSLSGSGRGGARGLAGFALGRLGDPTAVDALDRLSRSGQPTERMMAYLALGRLGGRGSTERLDRRLRERKLPAREHEAVIVALGLTGSGDVAPRLRRILETSGKDRLRRAAAVAAGYLDADVAWSLLRPRVSGGSEKDKRVRVIALKGCARMPPSADRFAALLKRRPDTISDAHEEAAWVLALAAAGGERELMVLARSTLSSPREEVREALAAATVVVGGNRASALASVLLGDPKDRVTRAALLAVVIHSGTNNTLPPLVAFAKHTDEQIRRAALCGDVYLRGAIARKALQGCLTPEYKDDARDLAKQLLAELGADESAARMLCRARLQRLLDENGLAPSWNLNAATTELVYEILDLEDATDRRGSGQPPGALPSGRPAPPATGPSPQEEDLRRHLDRYPYIDLRHRIEVPPIE